MAWCNKMPNSAAELVVETQEVPRDGKRLAIVRSIGLSSFPLVFVLRTTTSLLGCKTE